MKRPPKKPTHRRQKRPMRKPVRVDPRIIALELADTYVSTPTHRQVIQMAREKGIEVKTIGAALRKMGYSRQQAFKIFQQHFVEIFRAVQITPNIPIIRTLAQSAVREQYNLRPSRRKN